MDHCCPSKGLALVGLLFMLCATVLVQPSACGQSADGHARDEQR
jgi:hypothetical protein